MSIENINMDTRDFNESTDPWKGVRDVDVHEARDRQAAEARRDSAKHIAIPAGQAALRLPEFTSIQAPVAKEEAPLKRDRNNRIPYSMIDDILRKQ